MASPGGPGLRLRRQRERRIVAPFVPRAHVDLHVLVAGLLEREVLERPAPEADVAVADHGLGGAVAVLLQLLELLLELGGVLEGGLVGLAALVAGVLGPGGEDRA